MKIYDITMQLRNKMPVYPGDAPPSVDNMDYKNAISMSPHCGTHVDAPRHFIKKGKPLSDVPLDNFIGKAYLIDLSGDTRAADYVTREMLARADFTGYDIALIKTRNSHLVMREDRFDEKFVCIGGDAAEFLVGTGIKTVGFDYLTIDPVESEIKPAHNVLLGNDICIIEGLDLVEISEGEYFAVCLPLKLFNSDGAPARAVLISEVDI
jgi:arylformamidase